MSKSNDSPGGMYKEGPRKISDQIYQPYSGWIFYGLDKGKHIKEIEITYFAP